MKDSLNNFLTGINELESLLTYIDGLDPAPINLLLRRATSKSIIVVSCGLFEGYLKNSFNEFIYIINNMNIPAEYIDTKIWSKNKSNTLEVLKLINDKRLDLDFGDTIRILSTSFIDDEKIIKPELVKEAFSQTRANPSERVIKKLFDDIGINIFEKLTTKYDITKVGQIKMKLGNFLNLRHAIAHGDTGYTVPSLSEVKDYLYFLKNLASDFNRILYLMHRKFENNYYSVCFSMFK